MKPRRIEQDTLVAFVAAVLASCLVGGVIGVIVVVLDFPIMLRRVSMTCGVVLALFTVYRLLSEA